MLAVFAASVELRAKGKTEECAKLNKENFQRRKHVRNWREENYRTKTIECQQQLHFRLVKVDKQRSFI
jgi:hypothetical protein